MMTFTIILESVFKLYIHLFEYKSYVLIFFNEQCFQYIFSNSEAIDSVNEGSIHVNINYHLYLYQCLTLMGNPSNVDRDKNYFCTLTNRCPITSDNCLEAKHATSRPSASFLGTNV